MSTPAPPESLHVVEGLDGLEARLPPDLTVARFVYWIFATPPALVLAGVGLASSAGFSLLAAMGLFGLGLMIMGGVGRALERAVEWAGRRPLPPLALVFLAFGGCTSGILLPGLGTQGALLAGVVVGLLHAGLVWLFAKNRATLRLDRHSLQVRWLWRRVELPLEDLDGIERSGTVFPPLRAGGRTLPASRSVTEEQRAWLDARVRAEATRLRASLAAQGEDLHHQPAPPPELLAGLDRS